jgi:DNA-binding protein H-NS
MKAARLGRNEDSIHRAFERTALGAIVQSGTVLSETAQRLFEEWADIGRARSERGFDRISAFLQCRTLQDFAALQADLLRDNMETVAGYARKAREHSARVVDEAERRVGNLTELMTISTGEAGVLGQTAQPKPAHRAARKKSAHKRSAPAAGATARRRGRSR